MYVVLVVIKLVIIYLGIVIAMVASIAVVVLCYVIFI